MNAEKARDGSGQSPPVTHELPTESKWVNMCSHKEYLNSDSISFFICTNFHTKMFFSLLKMYVWINQINPTPAPLDAFLSAALFPKGYINKSCKLPYAFVELGMNLSICMFPPGMIPRLLQGKYFPSLTRKRGFLFFYTITASSKK